ncbi:MAG: TonB-dependent receptor plug domain-containing protein [Gemmatimonas sp.]|nr:TonB-dependent receptor plug domain-containing protein [Gemmatimonas sp.]
MRRSRSRASATPVRLIALVAAAVASAMGSGSVEAQETGTVRGRVVAESTLRPLIGAQVSISEVGRGALTNQNGEFLLVGVPAGEHVVAAQMIGYGTLEQSTTVSNGEAAQLDFSLSQEALALDEVVVTGQVGQARRREVGNAITQLRTAEIIEPIQTAENLLQGRAPGVRVTFTDASVGAGAAIRLRGNVSATQSNQPLIYIDGVRQPGDAYRSGGNTKAAGPLADINPNDIDRVEVIKGAAAATLYGSEAAAGVIQIFTKRGTSGEPRFSYQTDQSVAWVRDWGSEQRPRLNMDPWLQAAYGQTHSISATGGSPRFRYFVSGNVTDRTGTQVDELEDRYGLRSNVSISATETMTFDVNSMFSNHAFETMPSGNALHSVFFNVYRPPGNFVGGALPGEEQFEDQINTLRTRTVETTNQRAALGLTANWTPIENLTARATVGYDRMGQDQMEVVPFGHPTVPEGEITTASWHQESTTFDASASYQFDLPFATRGTLSVGGQLVRREEGELEGRGSGASGPRRAHPEQCSPAVSHTGGRANQYGRVLRPADARGSRSLLPDGGRASGRE